MTRALTYSLYLVREVVQDERSIFRKPDGLRRYVGRTNTLSHMTLYWKEPDPHPDEPNWLRMVKGHFTGPKGDFSGATLACAIVFKSVNRLFALTFGGGHFLLNESAIEPDFGLLACVGAMSDDALRAVERRRLENVPINLSTQAPLDLSLGEMELLDSVDLVKRLKGRIDVDAGLGKAFVMGKTIQGSQALKFSTQVSLEKMVDVAKEALASYRNKRHPRIREVVSFLRPVTDTVVLQQLEQQFDKDIKASTPASTLILAPPIFIDETVVTRYALSGYSRSEEYAEFPHWDEYVRFLGGKAPDAAQMRKHRAIAFKGPQADDVYGSWSVWKCMTAEYTVGNQRYVLDDGSWYSITKARYDKDLAAFQAAVRASTLPAWGGTKEEKDYLRQDLRPLGWTILDRTYISTPNGSRFEPCDAINPSTKTLYHIKRRDCGPAGLSHVFRQAVAGTQIPIYDPAALGELDKRIAARGGAFKIGNPRSWRVVIGIMMRRGDTAGDLPYFSVASAVAALRQFGTFGVDASIEFISA